MFKSIVLPLKHDRYSQQIILIFFPKGIYSALNLYTISNLSLLLSLIYTDISILENLQIYLIKATENHVQSYPQCSGKQMWVESGEIQRGSSWREQLKCDTFSFISKRNNLYTEAKSYKRWTKNAAVNIGSQVDMKYTSMSNTGLHETYKAY